MPNVRSQNVMPKFMPVANESKYALLFLYLPRLVAVAALDLAERQIVRRVVWSVSWVVYGVWCRPGYFFCTWLLIPPGHSSPVPRSSSPCFPRDHQTFDHSGGCACGVTYAVCRGSGNPLYVSLSNGVVRKGVDRAHGRTLSLRPLF